MAANVNSKFIEEKLAAAEQLMLAAQKEIFAAIESLEDTESDKAGVEKLFNSAGTLIRATTREKILVKHYGSAPKTAAISRGIN
jgi:ABC-type taurine transport system substrate-binding protein